jgi:molybdenum cofactor cytidylyltransferase
MTHAVVGLLLCAGSGSRFGGDKLLAPLARETVLVPAGTPVGIASCRHLRAAMPRVAAVVRPSDWPLIDGLTECDVEIIKCARAEAGMGASLACGVAATADADGWVVALADMPWIAPSTIALVAEALAKGADIAAPVYREERGHPVGFSRRHGEALAALDGDEGARRIVVANSDCITLIEVDDPGILRDVDTPDDLATR